MSKKKLFTMMMEPHTPSNPDLPCDECALTKSPFICMDRSFCEFKETGKTWKKANCHTDNEGEKKCPYCSHTGGVHHGECPIGRNKQPTADVGASIPPMLNKEAQAIVVGEAEQGEDINILFDQIDSLRRELEEIGEATGIAGVDEPLSALECVQSLRSQLEDAKEKINAGDRVIDAAGKRHGKRMDCLEAKLAKAEEREGELEGKLHYVSCQLKHKEDMLEGASKTKTKAKEVKE